MRTKLFKYHTLEVFVISLIIMIMWPAFSIAQETEAPDSIIQIGSIIPPGMELKSKRTLKSKTYFNPATGKLTTLMSSGYFHFKDEAGKFYDIDRRIVYGPDSTFYNAVNGLYKANFRRFSRADNFSITFETRDGSQFRSKLTTLAYFDRSTKQIVPIQTVNNSEAVVKGNKIVYPEIFTGVDLEYEYTDLKLKQRVYLSQKGRQTLPNPADLGLNIQNTFLVLISQFDYSNDLEAYEDTTRLTFKDQGNTYLATHEGTDLIRFQTKTGKNKFKLLEDIAFLQQIDSLATDRNESYTMLRRFFSSDLKNYLLTGVALGWLYQQSEGTIVLDPTISIYSPTDDTWIEYNNSNSFGTYTQIRIGRDYSSGWKRSLVKFDISSIPQNVTIQSAKIKLYFYRTHGGTEVNRTIQCHQMLKDWMESQADWYEGKSGVDWSVDGVGFNNVDAKSTPEDTHDWYNEYPVWKEYNVSSLAQNWINGTANNYGVIFWATNENTYTNKDAKWCVSSEYTDNVFLRPTLVVTYQIDPLVEYHYDAQNRPDTVIYGNAVVEIDQYDDDRDWLIRRDYKLSSSNFFYFRSDQSGDYDASGNILAQRYKHLDESETTMEYAYDDLYRLTEFKYNTSSQRTYSYDDNGNLQTMGSKSFSYGNDNNQLTSDGTRTFIFDQIGRVDSVAGTSLGYDIFNNMITYGNDSYEYDSNNQRIKKVENSNTKYYVRSNQDVLAEYDGSWNLEAEYVYGLRGMVVKMDSSGKDNYYFKDHLGSTRQMSGENLRRDYYPFGEHYNASGDGTNYLFTGKELDENTGLSYFGARYYDASIGRWLSMDPLAEKYPSLSPYNYCANNPLKYFDPDGRYKLDAKFLKNASYLAVERFISTLIGLKYFANNNPRVAQAFGNYETSIDDFANFGSGPLLMIGGRGGNAGIYPAAEGNLNYDSETIKISHTLIDKLAEAKTPEEVRYWKAVLLRIILHETGHWAWHTKVLGFKKKVGESKKSKKEPNEKGEEIENRIWGNFKPVDAYPEYDPLNNPYWNVSGEYDEDPKEVWDRIHNGEDDN